MKDNVFIKATDFELSSSDNLLVELNENSVNYAIVNPKNNSLKAIGCSKGSVNEIREDFLKHNFSNILISTITESFTFVPEVHYNDVLEHTFISLLQADAQSEEVFSNFLDHQNIRNIYALNSTLIENLNKVFSNAKIFTQINPFFEGCVLENNAEVNLNIKDGHFELLILNHKELVYYNIFEFKNNDEILYFLLLTLQQKEITTSAIALSGSIDESSELYLKLKNCFSSIQFNKLNTALEINSDFENVNLHQYFSLLGLHLCA